ncbi:flagellin N-terminal helical domain-containing protein [Arthrobacter sp. EPSL27]|uniref:flagellin N-terminal helical domain-containing protein n=1 Tax=Arthrobacter sp. EPSL27 TaxID=1745378 RepID=UPI00074A47EE|nr:flagellin [Arthrobacter sp. EPSL27]KUM36896.1 flagellin [Arthrobacter sp. EPSL27]
MGMQINTNMAANNAYRSLSNTQTDLSKSLEKLSSGLRINRAGDDAAGLAISEGLKSQIGGLSVAARNAQDGIGAVQTAEGGLNQAHSILQRLRDLGVQAANDTNNAESRGAIATEATSLVKELDRIAGSTNFNGAQLLDGSKATMSLQVGANADANSTIDVNLGGANVKSIATTLAGGDLSTTGSSFAATVASLTTAAATFTSTVTDPDTGAVTTKAITTAVLNDRIGDTAQNPNAADFQSVDEYAAALRSDANFAANFTVAVTKDANGAGSGIVVTALDGGVVSTTAAPAAGLATGGATTAVSGGLKFDSADNARASITMIDAQIKTVSTARADLGATQNRLESAVQTINVAKENLTASNSRIRDTDMAEEMVKFTRNNILSQAGTAMLAQANQSNQGVLQLLR